MLFTRTKHAARKLSRQLTSSGIPATELHGNLSQPQRDRNLAGFQSGDVRVLVATDIAARGIHVDDVALVVHVDPPTEHKAYTHRSGRTARAGASGDVVTLVSPSERAEVASMTRKAGIRPRTATLAPGAREIAALVGEPAPRVDPEDGPVAAARKPAAQPPAGSGGGGRSRAGAGGSAGGAGRRGGGRGQGRRGGTGSGGGTTEARGTGQARSGQARSGQARSGQSAPTTYTTSTHSAAAHSSRAGAGRGRGRAR